MTVSFCRATVPTLLLLTLGLACSEPGSEGGIPSAEADRAPVGVFAEARRTTTFPEPFSYLSGVRELADGRLLAADPLGQVVVRLDLASGVADTLGRVGEGPGEYLQPDRVFPLPGDSTLLVDLGKGRLTLLAPDGSEVSGIPMARLEDGIEMVLIHPRCVDASGRLYFQAARSRTGGPLDSAAVVRFDRGSETIDTVAWVWLPPYRRGRRGSPRSVMVGADDWAVGPDGRVAVVRADGYRLDWSFPDGSRSRGPQTPFQRIELTTQDKESVLAEMRATGISTTTVGNRAGIQSLQMSRGIPAGSDAPRIRDFEWPEAFPPFQREGTLVAPSGNAWVRRWRPVQDTVVYEVFGPDGTTRGRVSLPPGAKVIGFGKEGLFVARADELGLQWLEHFRLVGRTTPG